MRRKTTHTSCMKGQGHGAIPFIIFAVFYLLFMTWAAGEWAGSSDFFNADIVAPELPSQPGILEYGSFVIGTLWFYLSAFVAFNVAIPVLGLISVCIALVMAFIIATILWPF